MTPFLRAFALFSMGSRIFALIGDPIPRSKLGSLEELSFDWGPDSALEAWFVGGTQFRFNELSEGQRCLICLYAILHFVLAKGHTAILDEPDNFVSLREIQPWLMA